MHPDVNPALNSTDDAMRLNEAYAVLQLVSLARHTVCICQSQFWYSMGFLSIDFTGDKIESMHWYGMGILSTESSGDKIESKLKHS